MIYMIFYTFCKGGSQLSLQLIGSFNTKKEALDKYEDVISTPFFNHPTMTMTKNTHRCVMIKKYMYRILFIHKQKNLNDLANIENLADSDNIENNTTHIHYTNPNNVNLIKIKTD